MLTRKVALAASVLSLVAACSSGAGTGEDPPGARPEDEEGDAGTSGKGGASGKGGSTAKGGSGGTVSTGGKAGNGGSETEEAGAGGSGGSNAGAGGGSAGTGGKGGASGTGGAAGKSGAGGGSGSAGGGGTSGKGGAAGTGAGGASGTSAGGTSAGGTSAGGTSAGGTSAGGTSAGGTSAGGSGGAPACVPSAAAEVCYNGKDDDCNGSQDEACPPLSLEGNWRWTFAFDNAQRRTTLALVGGGNIAGNAIDEYGFATLTGTFTAGTKAFSITKTYDDVAFVYAGTATFTPAGVTVAGKWRQVGLTTETAFSGVLQDARAIANAAGAWKINAYFDPTVTANLAVSPQGYVTGTMSDDDGASTLAGMFDRGDGQLFVRKVYGGTGTTLWWKGMVAADGQSITSGSIGGEPETLDYGSWSGQR